MNLQTDWVNTMLKRLFYFLYLLFLVYIVWILPGEAKPHATMNLIPLQTIRLYFTAFIHGYVPMYIIISNLIGNIVLFIPIGFLLFNYLRHMGGIVILFFSFYIPGYIEIVQLLLYLVGYGTRSLDIDDVLLNMLGIWIGYFVAFIFWSNRSRKKST